jgi:thiamine monophosphate synthase
MTISTSCHNMQELQSARQAGADFALLSPVFPTQSHPNAPSLGLDTFHHIAEKSPLPIIALGGINPNNRQSLHGFAVAVIRAISESDNPKHAAQALLSA